MSNIKNEMIKIIPAIRYTLSERLNGSAGAGYDYNKFPSARGIWLSSSSDVYALICRDMFIVAEFPVSCACVALVPCLVVPIVYHLGFGVVNGDKEGESGSRGVVMIPYNHLTPLANGRWPWHPVQ